MVISVERFDVGRCVMADSRDDANDTTRRERLEIFIVRSSKGCIPI